ncbi:hypothetical protein N7G274_006016 [Stereocaulon virgatum]|uniref:DNA/RNA-binding protein Alba-like domain-containing protein n=1 Tax=Stereocaulon virgatum TaxID=373712 RepID=A0ABR4A9H4_9LECA
MTPKNGKTQRPQVNREGVANFKASKTASHSDTALRSTRAKRGGSDKLKQTQSAERLIEVPAPDVREGTLNQSIEHPASSKRSRAIGDDESSSHLSKRLKANGNNGPNDPSQDPVEGLTEQGSGRTVPGQDHNPTDNGKSQAIPAEVQHLRNKYDLTTMSILSSAKIEQKVRNLLDRVSKLNFADIKAKPGIVVLHAKAKTACKMVSIVQIAKQEIEKGKGRWYQYSKLHGEITELKARETKPKGGGKALAEWSKQKSGTGAVTKASEETCVGVVEGQKDNVIVGDEDEEMEDAFETMALPNSGLNSTEERRKIRSVPVMTIYFARVPVPGLKELYGEQTNA